MEGLIVGSHHGQDALSVHDGFEARFFHPFQEQGVVAFGFQHFKSAAF